MITLYRAEQCDACDEVQQTLRKLVVAHEVVDVEVDVEKDPPAAVAAILTDKKLPVIADGDKVISGEAALHDYLAELTSEMDQWRKYQTDACYISDKGKTC